METGVLIVQTDDGISIGQIVDELKQTVGVKKVILIPKDKDTVTTVSVKAK